MLVGFKSDLSWERRDLHGQITTKSLADVSHEIGASVTRFVKNDDIFILGKIFR